MNFNNMQYIKTYEIYKYYKKYNSEKKHHVDKIETMSLDKYYLKGCDEVIVGGKGAYYLKARVYGDEIDWKSTFYCNACLENENEIRLKEGEIIEIVGYYNSSKKYFSFKNPLYIKA